MLFALPVGAAAQAVDTVQLYGTLDAGIESEHGCNGPCPTTKLSSGIEDGSRVGFTGREQLGGDLSAVFTLEAGILVDTGKSDQNGRLFGRQAYVGLDSTRLGAVTLGRQYNLNYSALVDVGDPFKGGLAGAASNLVGYTQQRYDNAIKYTTPALNGWSAAGIYSFGEAADSTATNRAYGAMLGYAGAPVNVSVAYQRKNDPMLPAGVVQVDQPASNALVAANFNLGGGTAYAAFSRDRGAGSSWNDQYLDGAVTQGTPSTNSRDVLVGLSAPRGAYTFMTSYIRKDDRSPLNQDASQFAVGLSYSFSRRTDVYVSCARIHNRNGASYTVGNATSSGSGDRAVNIGLRHSF